MYITQAILHNFRKAVTKAWGQPVETQRDCIDLSEVITEATGQKVASHTLRRFFGLVAFDGQFRKSTLDALAKFTGSSSSEELIDRLKNEEDLVELLVRLQVENVDIDEYYINRLIERDVSMEAVMMAGHMILIRLEQKDYARVIRLLKTLAPLDTNSDRYFAICYVFAHYVAPTFYALEDDEFITQLMLETKYLDLVLSFFVPLYEMDGGFGRQIRLMLELSEDVKHHAFGHSLLATQALLQGDRDLALAHFDGIPPSEEPYFSILQGRIHILQYLLTDATQEAARNLLSPQPNEEIFYFKAVLPLLVSLNEVDLLEWILEQYKLDEIRANHWMEESVKKQVNLAQAWLLAKKGNAEACRALLKKTEPFPFPKDYRGASQAIIAATRAVLNS